MKLTTITLIACLTLAASTLTGLAGETKLIEPYAPKPSGPTPEGWEIKLLEGSIVESKTQLKNGREIKVSTPAYELVAKGDAIILTDPGFDPLLANAQTSTIGAILTAYSEETTNLQKKLEAVIADLKKGLDQK